MVSMRVVCQVLAILGLSAFPVHSDTVTLRSNESYNGTVTGLSAHSLKLEGNFKGKINALDVPLATVSIVEFNDIVHNSGAAPPFGAREVTTQPPDSAVPQPPSAAEMSADVLVLLGGQRVRCAVLSIDKNGLHCDGSEYERDRTYRIEFRRR